MGCLRGRHHVDEVGDIAVESFKGSPCFPGCMGALSSGHSHHLSLELIIQGRIPPQRGNSTLHVMYIGRKAWVLSRYIRDQALREIYSRPVMHEFFVAVQASLRFDASDEGGEGPIQEMAWTTV